MNTEQKKTILEKAGFKCEKCSYYSPLGNDLTLTNNKVLCSICSTFAPDAKDELENYLSEKMDWQELETFRKFRTNKSSHDMHKKSMLKKSKEGKLMARPPFGYKVINGELIIDGENKENVRLIFEEFSKGNSLNQISKIYGISVNGIKKILKNFTYLGKIKFNGQISQGTHQPLISSELFNRVQEMLEKNKKPTK